MSIPTADTREEQTRPELLLDIVLSLAQTQLVGQLADETGVDGRMMGTLGFSGALLAACVAARSLLGAFWWMPTLVLAIATLLCFSSMLWFGRNSPRKTDLGPDANAFYRLYGTQRPQVSREQLLSDLDQAFAINMKRLQAKEHTLGLAVLTLVIGVPLSAMCIGLF